MRRCGPFDCDCDRAGGCPDRSWCPSRRCREQCQRGSGPDGDVNRGWREYRWLGRSGRSIGRHKQHINRRKRWSQRRRRKRRAVGRWWGSRLVRDWRSRRQRRAVGSGGGVASSATGAAGASPAAASRSTGSSTAATTASRAPVGGVRQSITLPPILLPSGGSDRASAATAFDGIPGTPAAVVRACRDAVGSAAAPFGVVSVRARSAGSLRRLSRGAISAPVQVRIHYSRQGGPEIRQARIRCHLDASGKVIKLT